MSDETANQNGNMNSLADAAAQAAAAAAASNLHTFGTRVVSEPINGTESPPSGSRINLPPSASFRSMASPSPSSSSSPSKYDTQLQDQDTPVRRALLDSEKPEKRGSNLACLRCRAIKVKCSRANADDERCKRCNRLDLVCEFKEHHRGRKPKKRLKTDGLEEEDQLDDEQDIASPSTSTHPDCSTDTKEQAMPLAASLPSGTKKKELERISDYPEPPRLPSPQGPLHGRWLGPYLQPILATEDNLPFARKSSAGPQFPRPEMPHFPSSGSSRSSVNPHDSLMQDRNVAPSWSTQYQTHRAQALQSFETSVANDLRDDAIRQDVITLAQAQELFDYYFAELNPPLAALDAGLHTIDYCRQHLPILFSTILSVSTRFFRPHLYRQCHRICKSILNLAAVQEICSLDHIQALILVITWKDPSDRTTVRKAVRAIGYAYELGLHASFDETSAQSSPRAHDLKRSRSDSYGSRFHRRLDRDRQRTWIILCLIQTLVRKDDRPARPRARLIPMEDYPDPLAWLETAGDLLLSIDSRLAWSLEACLLIVELDPVIDQIAKSGDQSPFGGFFDRYRSRMDLARKRYFDIVEEQYYPKFPMDKSAIAELPYLDAYRDFFICEATWHWAARVAAKAGSDSGRRKLSAAPSIDYLQSKSQFCFYKTVEAALRCLRLFVQNLVKPGYLRVGHDYLVISASQAAKWVYLYRDSLDPTTVITATGYLQEIVSECSQPQRLPSGEIANIEREAPGYLVRFVEALMGSGLNAALEKAKAHFGNTDRYHTLNQARAESLVPGNMNRDRSHSSGHYDDRGMPRQPYDSANPARRPPFLSSLTSYRSSDRQMPAGVSSSYHREPSSRYTTHSGSLHASAASPSAVTSYERGQGSPHLPGSSNALTGLNLTSSSMAPHPAYLASPSSNTLTQSLPVPHLGQSTGTPAPTWASSVATTAGSPTNPIVPWNLSTAASTVSMEADLASSGLVGLAGTSAFGGSNNGTADAAGNVVPLAADLGKHSLDSLAANLGTHDLNYWQDILGSDLTTFV